MLSAYLYTGDNNERVLRVIDLNTGHEHEEHIEGWTYHFGLFTGVCEFKHSDGRVYKEYNHPIKE